MRTCVVNQNINTSELFQSFIHDLLTIFRLSEISKDVVCLNVRVLLFKVVRSFLYLLIRSEAIENNIVSPLGKGMSNTQPDTTQ